MNYCKKCGEPAPKGEEYCWLCSHTPTLPDECSEDSCEIHQEGGSSNE